MKKTLIQAGVLSFMMLSVAQGAIAADVEEGQGKDGAGPNVALFRELDMLRSQNAILAEKVKNAELRARIDQAGKSGAIPGANAAATPTAPGAAGFAAKGAAPVVAADLGSAQVQMVSGANANLVALVSLANGRQANARVGSTIPGVGVVQSIAVNEVLVETLVGKTKKIISLPFASENPGTVAATNLPAPAPAQGPAMPPLPPAMLANGAR